MRMMHTLQIIHKDIKPANILYSNSYKKVILCDFGISHIVN
jgi:serine/threonine protein kinase